MGQTETGFLYNIIQGIGSFGRRERSHAAIAEELRYRAEMTRTENFSPLTRDRVLELDMFYGGKGFHKPIYGDRPIAELVSKGFKFAERSYHEATIGPIAESAATYARDILYQLELVEGIPRVLELNTGTGSQTFALHNNGFIVEHTVEKLFGIYQWTKENLESFGIDGSIGWSHADAWDVVTDMAKNQKKFDIVFADPPWSGIHYSQNRPGDFSYMLNKPDRIVPHLLRVTDVVAIKAKGDVRDEIVQRLAGKMNCGVFVLSHNFEMGERRLLEKFIYFINGRSDLGLQSRDVDINLESLYLT